MSRSAMPEVVAVGAPSPRRFTEPVIRDVAREFSSDAVSVGAGVPQKVRLTGVRGWATEVGRESKCATVRLCTTSPRPVGTEPHRDAGRPKGQQQQPLEPTHDHLLIAGHRTGRQRSDPNNGPLEPAGGRRGDRRRRLDRDGVQQRPSRTRAHHAAGTGHRRPQRRPRTAPPRPPCWKPCAPGSASC